MFFINNKNKIIIILLFVAIDTVIIQLILYKLSQQLYMDIWYITLRC